MFVIMHLYFNVCELYVIKHCEWFKHCVFKSVFTLGADRDGPRTDRRPPVTATASAVRGNDRRPVASGGRGAWKRPEGEREPVTAVVSIKQKKEKPLPTTIDELPKLEDKSKKVRDMSCWIVQLMIGLEFEDSVWWNIQGHVKH